MPESGREASEMGRDELRSNTDSPTDNLRRELEALTVPVLRKVAKRLGLGGVWNCPKADLIDKLLAADVSEVHLALEERHRNREPSSRKRLRDWWTRHSNHVYGVASVLGVALAWMALVPPRPAPPSKFVVGGKHFLESSVLAEIIATTLEHHLPDLRPIERRFGLKETTYCIYNLHTESIQVYPEYSGTVLAQHIGMEPTAARDPALHTITELNRQLTIAKKPLQELAWVADFGFHNGYTLAMERSRLEEILAGSQHTPESATISVVASLAKDLAIGAANEAVDREDCLGGINASYPGIARWRRAPAQTQDELYERLRPEEEREIEGLGPMLDVIVAFTTDPQLHEPARKLVQLRDDASFFIPYYVGPLVKRETLEAVPGLESALQKLQGCFGPAQADPEDRSDGNTAIVKLLKEVRGRGIRHEDLERCTGDDCRELRDLVEEWLVAHEVISEPKPSKPKPK